LSSGCRWRGNLKQGRGTGSYGIKKHLYKHKEALFLKETGLLDICVNLR
jgi:hypothetical protein